MEKKLEDLSNNEIFFEIKQLEADYEALKVKMLKEFEELEKMELKFNKATQILNKRLNT